MYLEEKFGIPIEKIPEYIIQGKKTLDSLEDQRQEILRKKLQAREELDTIVAELEKYGKEIPSIKRIKELERELDEIIVLIRNLNSLGLNVAIIICVNMGIREVLTVDRGRSNHPYAKDR